MSHVLALPLFILTANDVPERVVRWNASPPTASIVSEVLELAPPIVQQSAKTFAATPGAATIVAILGSVPILWSLVAANVVSQYVCIEGVYHLQVQSTLTTV
jgi:hypothetical protein